MTRPLPAVIARAALAAVLVPAPATPQQLKVVTSLTTYASITREIAGDRAEVTTIANGAENPHFVQPKPSFVVQLAKADLFVTTGLDLELWVPALLDKANNRKVREGGPGYVAVYPGIQLLDVPATLSRSQGDIHIYGNPHVWTDPANAVVIARNIAAGLKRADPTHASEYDQRLAAFSSRIAAALVGEELVQILGAEAVTDLALGGDLRQFLQANQYQGRPLAARLGGWLKAAEAFRGRELACYHKEWDYFNRRFGLSCVTYIEPKPGIPPSPRHVEAVIRLMRERHVPALFSSTYFDRNQVNAVAERTGSRAVVVPTNTEGAPGVDTYFDLIDLWIRSLTDAVSG